MVIAAFNEATVIESVVREVCRAYRRVVVVDDGSSDDTAARAHRCGATVLRHPINVGQGAALQTGITYALLQRAEMIVTFDADGQHRVRDIAALLDTQRQTKADVVLGSRLLGHATNIPQARLLMLKLAVRFMRWRSGIRLSDAHNGLRLFTRSAAEKIRISQNRMAHASEIVEQIHKLGLAVAEAPVTILYTPYSLHKGQKISNALDILVDMFVARLRR